MARFVLVHGAFGGSWCWDPVVPFLDAAGHEVQAPDLPGSGADRTTPIADVTLDAYADRVCEVLASRPNPAILVGHSMGGVVVTQAAARAPQHVARLVYVAAFAPADGQSLLDLTQLPEGADDQIQANIVVSGEPPVAELPDAAAREAIGNCCTDEQWAEIGPRRRPQAVVPFATPVSLGSEFDAIPKSYVMCLQDHSIPPALQRRMAAERGCDPVLELDTDHFPEVSATYELANMLLELAKAPASV